MDKMRMESLDITEQNVEKCEFSFQVQVLGATP